MTDHGISPPDNFLCFRLCPYVCVCVCVCELRTSYLFVPQGSGGFERGRGPQAAERPGLGDFGGLQEPSAGHGGAEALQGALVRRGANHTQGLTLHRLEAEKEAHSQG